LPEAATEKVIMGIDKNNKWGYYYSLATDKIIFAKSNAIIQMMPETSKDYVLIHKADIMSSVKEEAVVYE
jgi:hypothetical protein